MRLRDQSQPSRSSQRPTTTHDWNLAWRANPTTYDTTSVTSVTILERMRRTDRLERPERASRPAWKRHLRGQSHGRWTAGESSAVPQNDCEHARGNIATGSVCGKT